MALSFSVTMPAYSSLFLNTGKNIDEGDKVVLPDTVLRGLLQLNAPIGRVSHCGVLEFTAQDEAAFMPNWMLENLLLSDGAPVRLTLCTLPKLTFVRFQPLQYAFTKIPNPKAALEEALLKFTALTRGDTILLRYHHEEYMMQVTDVQPDTGEREPPAGCVIDATIEVDFDPPLEEAPKEEKISVLELDVPEQGHVMADQFKYYRVKLRDPSIGLRVSIDSTGTRPDVYISTSVDRPSPTNSMFSGSVGSPAEIRTDSPGFSKSWYYIAVHSFGQPAAYTLLATQVEDDVQQGQQLGKIPSPVASSSDLASTPPGQRCDNCMRVVPAASFQMHSIVCARNNWACPQCRKVMPVRERNKHAHCDLCDAVIVPEDKEKHIALFHAKVKCRCGQEMDALALPSHQEKSCQFRLQPCRWCGDSFPLNQKYAHEQMCGSKTVPCARCGKAVIRRQTDIHNAAEHGINPCLDASGNRRTVASVETEERQARAQELLPTYGANLANNGNDEDAMVAQAIAASLNYQGGSSASAPANEEMDPELARALAASMEASAQDQDLARAIAASMEVDAETQRDLDLAIAASLAESPESKSDF
ncbi:unnamed protein product (mitochondrion) [Plasmodiophora brassicae]|uniref:Ubiquitin-protein ligase E3A N-terminal zinc-binding domain-containing protein n=1 Tax=Plasmodiophora brassicae TaxID=37360 RepID=A0A3P3YGG5_PLABS|nr:unnamed protein product [Plasmodiophora brassicae]